MSGHRRVTRRDFLKGAAAVAAPLVVSSSVFGANDRFTMGAIGMGGRGRGDTRTFTHFSELRVIAVCDVDRNHAQMAKAMVDKHYGNHDCHTATDFREITSRDDIDSVFIGTPDHWHAIITIDACKNGKDVFCEKPETLTIGEGRAMVKAVRRYSRVFGGGSQRVLGDYGTLPRRVRGRAVGEIRECFVACGGPSKDCYLPAEPLPKGLDWDMWLGPAPWRPYHPNLTRGGFRPFRDYSGGGMTDWGAHRFGSAMFAIGVHKEGPVEVIPPDGKDVKLLTFIFKNGLKMYHGGTGNLKYVGTDGELPGSDKQPQGDVEIEGYRGRGLLGDFVESVKQRKPAFRDIEIAHRATTVCHLGNIAYWLKRPLKYDPVKEEIVGDPEANRWIDRPKREPWTLEV